MNPETAPNASLATSHQAQPTTHLTASPTAAPACVFPGQALPTATPSPPPTIPTASPVVTHPPFAPPTRFAPSQPPHCRFVLSPAALPAAHCYAPPPFTTLPFAMHLPGAPSGAYPIPTG
eukprot:10972213-Ditylum_brightwellii.AAC.1